MANPYNPYGTPAALPTGATPAIPDPRSQFTGALGSAGGVQQGSSIAPLTPQAPDNSSQLAGHALGVFSGYPSMTPAQAAATANNYYGYAPGQSSGPVRLAGDPMTNYEGASTDQYAGQLGQADLNLTQLGGAGTWSQPAKDANAALQLQAAGAAMRQAPQLQTGAVNLMNSAAENSLNSAQYSNLYQAQQANNASAVANGAAQTGQLNTAGNLAGLAGGQAVQQQMNLAGQLQGLAAQPTGPSVAQQQLAMGANASMQQQMAMAAGARGGNAALALQNAGQNQGQAMGQLNQQQALLRSQEDLANRQFSAQALQGASGIYGQAGGQQIGALSAANQGYGGAAGTQLGAYGTAGQMFGQQATNQVAQGNTNAGMAGTYAGLASDQGKLDLGQTAQNDSTMLGSQNMGYGLLTDQRNAGMNAQQQNINSTNTRYGIDQGIGIQQQQVDNQQTASTLGAIGSTVATVLPLIAMASDIRGKTEIAPASGEVADAFRPLSSSSYFYKDPNAPGAAQGQQFGPMAQQLEQTPAGASAVTQMADGRKGIDTGRLALLNASATADMRRELDAIKGQGDSIRDAYIPKPMGGIADAHLRPDLAPAVPQGAARPFAPGEYVDNPDGSWSSERSMTVPNRDGSWGVVPSVWLKDGKPYEAKDEAEAATLSKKSKLPFQRFKDLKGAEKYALDREAAWQPLERPEDAASIPPLWAPRTGTYGAY